MQARAQLAKEFRIVHIQVEGTRIVILEGDLTVQDVDVLVNAANEVLREAAAWTVPFPAGGPAIMSECDSIRER